MLYECMVLFSPELSSDELEAARTKFEDTLSKNGGTVALWDHWGDRRLTYPIKKKNRAFYSLAYIDATNEARAELVRMLKLNDGVLRHMIVRPPVAPDLAAIASKGQARAEYEREREAGPRSDSGPRSESAPRSESSPEPRKEAAPAAEQGKDEAPAKNEEPAEAAEQAPKSEAAEGSEEAQS